MVVGSSSRYSLPGSIEEDTTLINNSSLASLGTSKAPVNGSTALVNISMVPPSGDIGFSNGPGHSLATLAPIVHDVASRPFDTIAVNTSNIMLASPRPTSPVISTRKAFESPATTALTSDFSTKLAALSSPNRNEFFLSTKGQIAQFKTAISEKILKRGPGKVQLFVATNFAESADNNFLRPKQSFSAGKLADNADAIKESMRTQVKKVRSNEIFITTEEDFNTLCATLQTAWENKEREYTESADPTVKQKKPYLYIVTADFWLQKEELFAYPTSSQFLLTHPDQFAEFQDKVRLLARSGAHKNSTDLAVMIHCVPKTDDHQGQPLALTEPMKQSVINETSTKYYAVTGEDERILLTSEVLSMLTERGATHNVFVLVSDLFKQRKEMMVTTTNEFECGLWRAAQIDTLKNRLATMLTVKMLGKHSLGAARMQIFFYQHYFTDSAAEDNKADKKAKKAEGATSDAGQARIQKLNVPVQMREDLIASTRLRATFVTAPEKLANYIDEVQKSTSFFSANTKVNEADKANAKTTEVGKSDTKASEADKANAKTTEVAKSDTKANEIGKPRPLYLRVFRCLSRNEADKSNAKTTEVAKSDTKANEADKANAKTTEVAKSGTKVNEIGKPRALYLRVVRCLSPKVQLIAENGKEYFITTESQFRSFIHVLDEINAQDGGFSANKKLKIITHVCEANNRAKTTESINLYTGALSGGTVIDSVHALRSAVNNQEDELWNAERFLDEERAQQFRGSLVDSPKVKIDVIQNQEDLKAFKQTMREKANGCGRFDQQFIYVYFSVELSSDLIKAATVKKRAFEQLPTLVDDFVRTYRKDIKKLRSLIRGFLGYPKTISTMDVARVCRYILDRYKLKSTITKKSRFALFGRPPKVYTIDPNEVRQYLITLANKWHEGLEQNEKITGKEKDEQVTKLLTYLDYLEIRDDIISQHQLREDEPNIDPHTFFMMKTLSKEKREAAMKKYEVAVPRRDYIGLCQETFVQNSIPKIMLQMHSQIAALNNALKKGPELENFLYHQKAYDRLLRNYGQIAIRYMNAAYLVNQEVLCWLKPTMEANREEMRALLKTAPFHKIPAEPANKFLFSYNNIATTILQYAVDENLALSLENIETYDEPNRNSTINDEIDNGPWAYEAAANYLPSNADKVEIFGLMSGRIQASESIRQAVKQSAIAGSNDNSSKRDESAMSPTPVKRSINEANQPAPNFSSSVTLSAATSSSSGSLASLRATTASSEGVIVTTAANTTFSPTKRSIVISSDSVGSSFTSSRGSLTPSRADTLKEKTILTSTPIFTTTGIGVSLSDNSSTLPSTPIFAPKAGEENLIAVATDGVIVASAAAPTTDAVAKETAPAPAPKNPEDSYKIELDAEHPEITILSA